MHIEAAKAERPLPNHGDDRVVLLPQLGRFALFDGAGQSMASDIAADTFREQHGQAQDSPPRLNDVFNMINSRLLEFNGAIPDKYWRAQGNVRTTGVAVGIRTFGESPALCLEHAHAGDSSIHLFDHKAERLSRLTRDEWYHNFLGSDQYQLEQWGGRKLLSPHISLALFSDGVGSEEDNEWNSNGGITADALRSILADYASCEDKAQRILEASRINDDRSVIVIEATQQA